MKINLELDITERELSAFLDDCLMNQRELIVNNVDLTGIYRQISTQLEKEVQNEQKENEAPASG